MADNRRGESKQLKKDQQVRREVRSEIGSEINQDGSSAQYRNANRDQARGDWDRSRRHTDEERSRDDGSTGDDGLRPPGADDY
jgi:hypothetical protein